jgi:ribosome-binding factor A
MRMRTVPALTFRMDGSMVYGAKMDELFKNLTYSTPAETEEQEEE